MLRGMQTDETAAATRQIGRYVDLVPLGQGAMGTVYRARDPELDRVVAIKVLVDSSPAFVARFRREAQSVAKLAHPHVVQIYDVGLDEGGKPYFVMELLAGRPLDKLLREEGRQAPDAALRIGEQAADALAAAHAIGIVHRDIKPGNLVLDGRGQLKVVDFGIARVTRDDVHALTNGATLLGTPGYMAPEQAQGKPVDGRADVYALGVTLHELMTGKPPFPGSDPISILVKSLEEPLPDLRRAPVPIPDEVASVIEKMTAKDPEARYPTMQAARTAMAAAIRTPRFAVGSLPDAQGGTEAVVPPTAVTELTPRPAMWPWAVAGALLAIAAFAGWRFLPRGETAAVGVAQPVDAAPTPTPRVAPMTGPLRVAVLKFKNLSGDAALDMLETGIGETAIAALAGQLPGIALLERSDLESNITEIDRAGDLHFDRASVAALGKLQGIEFAVLGAVQRAGDEIRITARLVRVVTGEVLYSMTHTGKGSLFEAQDAVAKLVDEKLRLLVAKEGR
jgi:eukaryotic-like serine/threonine-protein kinase